MDTTLPSPFETVDRAVQELEDMGAGLILVDVHAEATSEKQTMGWHLDGRVAAVLGTHTHVPTADLRVLPGGTAYATDVGMIGDADGIIGVDREKIIEIFFEEEKIAADPAQGPVRLDAVLVEVELENGRAASIKRVFREWDG
jgi:calcineurin-like phosphoesterase